jgi:integrase/recombinase XerD
MTTLGTLIISFFTNYLVNQKGYPQNTISSYSDCIRLLILYSCDHLKVAIDKLKLSHFTDNLILDFLDHLEKECGNKVATRNQRLAAIKTFFRFLALQNPTFIVVCERVCAISAKKTEHKVLVSLENDEVNAIFTAVKTDTLWGARDQALLYLLYNTGGRVQELVDLDVSDLRMEEPCQVLLTGKGQKQRTTPLFPETVSAIKHYLKLRDQSRFASKVLFVNTQGNRITRFGIRHIVKKYADLASETTPSLKTKKVTPHTFRHTIALHLIQSGNDITVVREWLGHADIKTTTIYVEINNEMKRKVLETFPPPAAPQTNQPNEPLWHDPPILGFLKNLSRQAILCEVEKQMTPIAAPQIPIHFT